MTTEIWNTENILRRTMQHVAPLPSQADYARALASIFSMHIHRNQLIDDGIAADELPAPSAVVVAPTGQGKTFLVRKMAQHLGLNIITVDCGTLSAEGWKGVSMSQRLSAAYREAKDKNTFAQSILFLDEIDKLRLWDTHNDQGNAMNSILQMFNSGTVAVDLGKETRHISISRFTVLLGGAFQGLDKIIEERVCPKVPIGFGSSVSEKKTTAELMQEVTMADLVKYGLMPELLGRIGTILSIPPLGMEDYRQLLNADAGSLRTKYHNYLTGSYSVDFLITEAAVDAIARKCIGAITGARAVNPLINDLMRNAIAAVESDDSICHVVLDAEGDNCFLTYEPGAREYCFRDPARLQSQEQLRWHTVRANNIPAMVRKLCRYYRNAEGKQDVPQQLNDFLSCAVTYLHRECHPSEFCFDSLEKLARATCRDEHPKARSPFDVIMQDARTAVPYEMYQRFSTAYNRTTTANLTDALRTIMRYIQAHHGTCRVRFCVPQRNVQSQ